MGQRSKVPGYQPLLKDTRDFQTFEGGLTADGRQKLARLHVAGRTERMVKLLAATAAIAAAAKWPGASKRLQQFNRGHVRCTKAELQAVAYPFPEQAAHYLPGQIKVGGLPPWEFLNNIPQQDFLRLLFQDTDRLRFTFNQADSAVEDGPLGMKRLAAQCVKAVIQEHASTSAEKPDRRIVHNVYTRLWLPGAKVAVAEALARKRSKPGVPKVTYVPDSLDPRLIAPSTIRKVSEAKSSQWNVDEVVKILEDYQDAPPEGALLDAFSKWREQTEAVFG
jgi:hypothetical protein